jgi:hypothetical protein
MSRPLIDLFPQKEPIVWYTWKHDREQRVYGSPLQRTGESREKRERRMAIPTLDQTEGIWIGRTSDQGFHYVQDVFPGDTPRDRWHQANCQVLIARGHLLPEYEVGPVPPQRVWDQTRRYKRVHT